MITKVGVLQNYLLLHAPAKKNSVELGIIAEMFKILKFSCFVAYYQ
jgi:hypothetical protein